jgi:hypothetical protein
MDSVHISIDGVELGGPVDGWQGADGYWTDALAAAAAAELREGRAATCPVCGNPANGIEQERVYGQRASSGFTEFAGGVGWLVTLSPCGHTLKR